MHPETPYALALYEEQRRRSEVLWTDHSEPLKAAPPFPPDPPKPSDEAGSPVRSPRRPSGDAGAAAVAIG